MLNMEGQCGDVYMCGEATEGTFVPLKHLRGKKIKSLCASRYAHVILSDSWEFAHTLGLECLEDLVSGLGDVKLQHVAFGQKHALGLSLDGHVYSWGSGIEGQLGAGSFVTKAFSPDRIFQHFRGSFVQLATGAHHSMALSERGSVYAWGRGFEGQTGLAPKSLTTEDQLRLYGMTPIPKAVGILPVVSHVACGENFTIVIEAKTGTLWSFGENQSGQCGIGSLSTVEMTPKPMRLFEEERELPRFQKLACGWAHTLALTTNGTIWSFGLNSFGQLGLGDDTNVMKCAARPRDLAGKWSDICASGHYSVARKDNGRVWTWGSNAHGRLGHGTPPSQREVFPRLVEALTETYVSGIACARDHVLYFAPTTVASIGPALGPTTGQTLLTISGSGFWDSEDLTVRFAPTTEGRLTRAALGTFDPETKHIHCMTPKFSAPGDVLVEVAMNGKTFSTDGQIFRVYCPPEIVQYQPMETHVSGGEECYVYMNEHLPTGAPLPYLKFICEDGRPSSMTVVVVQAHRCDVTDREWDQVITVDEKDVLDEHLCLRVAFMTPSFVDQTLERVSTRLEFSLNNKNFMPVLASTRSDMCAQVDNMNEEEALVKEAALMHFHDARLDRLLPNSVTFSSKSTPLSIFGQHFFNYQHSLVVRFEYLTIESGHAVVGPTLRAFSHVRDAQVTSDAEIQVEMPEFSSWTYIKTKAEVEQDEWMVDDREISGEEDNMGDRTMLTTSPSGMSSHNEWWMNSSLLCLKVKISLNGGTSYIPTKSESVSKLYVVKGVKIDQVVPTCGPVSGGTDIQIRTTRELPFDSTGSTIKIEKSREEPVIVDAQVAHHHPRVRGDENVESQRRVHATTPRWHVRESTDTGDTGEHKKTADGLEEEEEPAVTVVQTLISVALDGRNYTSTSVPFSYYYLPSIVDISPREIQQLNHDDEDGDASEEMNGEEVLITVDCLYEAAEDIFIRFMIPDTTLTTEVMKAELRDQNVVACQICPSKWSRQFTGKPLICQISFNGQQYHGSMVTDQTTLLILKPENVPASTDS